MGQSRGDAPWDSQDELPGRYASLRELLQAERCGAEGRVGTEEIAERGAAANQGRGDILDSRNGGGVDCEGINRGGGLEPEGLEQIGRARLDR